MSPSASIPHDAESAWVSREDRLLTMLVVARIVTEQGDALCRIRNVSSGGLMLETGLPLETGQAVRVELRNGSIAEGTVAWSRPPRAGLHFSAAEDVARFLGSAEAERLEPRRPRAPRLSANCRVALRIDGRQVDAVLVDMSQSGCCVRLAPGTLRVGQEAQLEITGLGTKRAIVRWVRDEQVGLSFVAAIGFDMLNAWLLRPDYRFAAQGGS